MLRYRGKKLTEVVQKLDSFPKIPTDYQEYTGIGGIFSIFMYLFAIWLVLTEIAYFVDYKIHNLFVPDVEFDAKLNINIDMTIAALCSEIAADIVDVTNQDGEKFGSFQKEDTWFELDPESSQQFDEIRRINLHLRDQYHSLRNVIWKSGYMSYLSPITERLIKPDYPHDACRIRAVLEINKVAGNFHITSGHSVAISGGHIHIPQLFSSFTNLSHRIEQFSFGSPSPGIVHPLDGTMKVTHDQEYTYKYFIEVVPTDIETYDGYMKTYQYSVKELVRPIDHNKFTHEISGIFFKYDVHPLKVIIREKEYTLFQLIIRICGCIGGLYIVTGAVKHIIDRYFTAKVISPTASSFEVNPLADRITL